MTHNYKFKLFFYLKLAIVIFAVASLTNCTSVSRGLANLTDNKYGKARSGSKWIIAPPQLEPLSQEQKTVYISFKNISDAASINLKQIMVDDAVNQGWQIVNDPNMANFRVRATLRYFGEVAPESGGIDQAASFGGVAGAAVGFGAGIIALDNADSIGEVAVGVGAAAIAGAGIANASMPREWALILDVLLEEYSNKGFEYSVSTSSGNSNLSRNSVGSQRDFFGNERGNAVSDGAQTQSLSKSASITKKSNYFPYGTRLSVWANQMNMREDEALPELKMRLEQVIGQLLPE